MNAKAHQQFEQVELTEEITNNYQRMLNARASGETVLVETFELRMNRSLENYRDLLRALGGATLEAV